MRLISTYILVFSSSWIHPTCIRKMRGEIMKYLIVDTCRSHLLNEVSVLVPFIPVKKPKCIFKVRGLFKDFYPFSICYGYDREQFNVFSWI